MDADLYNQAISGGTLGDTRRNWFVDAAEQWLVGSQIDNLPYQIYSKFGTDKGFNPYANGYMTGYEQYHEEFIGVRTEAEADAIKRNIDNNLARRERIQASGRWFAPMVGEILTPENLTLSLVPMAGMTGGVLKGALKAGAIIGATELGMEVAWHRPGDPTRTIQESVATVGGATLLGGAFYAGLRGADWAVRGIGKRTFPQVQASIEKGFTEEMVEQSGRPNIMQLDPREGLHQRLSTTHGGNTVRIFPAPDDPNGGTAIAYSVNQEQAKVYTRDFIRKFRDNDTRKINRGEEGWFDINDPVWKAFDKGEKAKKGTKGYDEFYEILGTRIQEGQNLEQALALKPGRVNWSVQEALQRLEQEMNLPYMRQVGENPWAGYIAYDDKAMRATYNEWVTVHNRDIDKLRSYKGLNPPVKDFADWGLTADEITSFEDYRELILRHELWHQSYVSDFAKPGKRKTSEQLSLDESEVNRKAVEDYRLHRQAAKDLNKVEYQSKAMKWADGVLGGRLAKGQTAAANWLTSRVGNNPVAVGIRRAKDMSTVDEFLRLGGDGSIITEAQQAGRPVGPSVQTATRSHEAAASVMAMELGRLFRKSLGKEGDATFAGVNVTAFTRPRAFQQFTEDLNRLRMQGVKPRNDIEARGIAAINRFYENSNLEMNRADLLWAQTMDGLETAKRQLDYDYEQAVKFMDRELDNKFGSKRPFTAEEVLRWNPEPKRKTKTWAAIKQFRDEWEPKVNKDEFFLKTNRMLKADRKITADLEHSRTITNAERDNYFQRIYNTKVIRAYRDWFTDRLEQSFLDDPFIYVEGKGYVATDPATARERAEQVVKEILNEVDVGETQFSLTPGSMKRRIIPLKNKDLIDMQMEDGVTVDFIHVEPIGAANSYARRMGAQVEFAKRYRNEKRYLTPEDQFEDQLRALEAKELKAGNDPETVQKMMRDLRYLKDAVTHRVSQNPDHWSREATQFAKNLTHLSTMGGSGLIAANELASIYLTQGFKRMWKFVVAQNGENTRAFMAKNKDSLEKMAVYLETSRGVADVRFNDSVFDPQTMSATSIHMQRATNAMFIANMMGPITVKLKALQGNIVIDRTLRAIADQFDVNGFKGKGADDLTYLNQQGMPIALRKRIANELKRNWKDIYEPNDDLFAVDTRQWADQDAARAFHEYLTADIENTIIVANTSTKWKVMDGVLHIPKNKITEPILGKYNMQVDEGFYRVEHPLLSLPFMYMSWPLAATNKIAGRALRGEYAAPFGFLLASVGLSYFLQEGRAFLQGKPRDFISLEDKILNALFMSNTMNITADYWEKGGGLAAAVARDMGYDVEEAWWDPRIPHRKFLDIESGAKTAFDTAVGPGISKPIDGVRNLLDPGKEDLGDLFRNVPLNNMPFFAMFTQWIKDTTEGAFIE